MKKNQFTHILFFLLICVSCRTSGDVSRGKTYVDPTEVKTEDESGTTQRRESQTIEELRRQNAVIQGELEAARAAHSRDNETANLRLKALEEENLKLKEAKGAFENSRNSRPRNADEAWSFCLKSVDAKNYEKSAEDFEDLLTTYPKSAWVFHSQLGKAISLYNTGDFKAAALIFNQLIDRYPKKPEISLAWFGQGSAFFKMGQKQDAKLFFTEVTSRFPKSEEAPIAKKVLEKKRLPPPDLFVAFPGWSKYAPKAL